MAFDKAEWQYESAKKFYCEKFNKNPDELTGEDEEIIWDYAGNHIAIFLTWLIKHDYMGEVHHEDKSEEAELEAVKNQEKTGMDILRKYCDMVFNQDDVSNDIEFFVRDYYENQYMNDYSDMMGESRILSTAFSWEDYQKIEPVIDEALFEFGF
jgi:hypothetical protein